MGNAEDDEGVDASIPLDDDLPVDFAAIEVVQCLIEHHNAIFTDANETVWRWLWLSFFFFMVFIGLGKY